MRYAAARRLLPGWLVRHVYHFEATIEAEVTAFAASLPAGARVLDAGAGEGQYAAFFAGRRYVGVDLGVGDAAWNYHGLDAVADLNRLPFPDDCFDAALNIVTLEHLREPHLALREMARVLRPGGRLLLIAPHQWEVHQEPHDYFRYTGYGLQWLLEQARMRAERMEGVGGMFRLLSRRLLGALQFFPGPARVVAALLFVPPALLLPWLDPLDRRKLFTLGYVCVARKP
jgi:SAM-dependent methyltransferase